MVWVMMLMAKVHLYLNRNPVKKRMVLDNINADLMQLDPMQLIFIVGIAHFLRMHITWIVLDCSKP